MGLPSQFRMPQTSPFSDRSFHAVNDSSKSVLGRPTRSWVLSQVRRCHVHTWLISFDSIVLLYSYQPSHSGRFLYFSSDISITANVK